VSAGKSSESGWQDSIQNVNSACDLMERCPVGYAGSSPVARLAGISKRGIERL